MSCVDNPVMLEPLPYKVSPLIVVADITPLTVNPVKLLIFVVFTPPVGFVIVNVFDEKVNPLTPKACK